MSKMYFGSIDLNKIDKSRIIRNDKNGVRFKNKAKYYPIIVWINDEPSKYGAIGTIREKLSQEERENGEKPATICWLEEPKDEQAQKTEVVKDDDDLPF